jgi:hypothetical protein
MSGQPRRTKPSQVFTVLHHDDEIGTVEVEHLPAPKPNGAAEEPTPTIAFKHLPDPFQLPQLDWHARGLLVKPTHGQLAGPEKALKSYIGLAVDVGLTLGVDVLGRWPVHRAQRVLALTGEGGELGFLRRLQRIAAGYGATVDDVRPMLRYTTETAPTSSLRFRDALAAELDAFQPDLVHLDPWYAFAPNDVDARNLYEQGAALEQLGQLVRSGGATLLINNHYNQTGSGGGLRRITMAGHAEWCDSWLLLDHREPPNVDAGRFRLKLTAGSRQWGGTDHWIDFDIGRWDENLNDHIGGIRWAVTRPTEPAGDDDRSEREHLARVEVVKAWKRRRGRRSNEPLSREDWLRLVPGRNDLKRAAFQQLLDDERIEPVTVEVTARNGTRRTVDRYRLNESKLEMGAT